MSLEDFLEERGIPLVTSDYMNGPSRYGIVEKALSMVPEKLWAGVDVMTNTTARGGWIRPAEVREGRMNVAINFSELGHPLDTAHASLHEMGHIAEEMLGKKGLISHEEPFHHGQGQFFADFFALYILDGEKLREKISGLEPEKREVYQNIYETYKKHVFDGKEFSKKDVKHIEQEASRLVDEDNKRLGEMAGKLRKSWDKDEEALDEIVKNFTLKKEHTPFTHRAFYDMDREDHKQLKSFVRRGEKRPV